MVGALSSLRGFGLVAGAESSYGERWPPATLFFMSLLVVALFGLVVGALSSHRGFGLLGGAENSYRGRWPSATLF